MKTSELTGHALNWAVAKCEGKCEGDFAWYYDRRNTFNYSNNWGQGGPIIEREGLTLTHQETRWTAQNDNDLFAHGPTPLIAAMRCHVAAKLGGTVNVPEELTK